MTLVVKRLRDGKQEFLDGHTNVISSVALSHSGRLVATGQMTHAGFQVLSKSGANITYLLPINRTPKLIFGRMECTQYTVPH